jgi:PilZ domain
MEQRAEARFAIDQPVAVMILGGKEIREKARVRNVSPAGLQLISDRVIPAGSAIKIELDNALALGEVVYCVAEGDHSVLGVKLEHVLNGLAELQRKLVEFADEPIPERAE